MVVRTGQGQTGRGPSALGHPATPVRGGRRNRNAQNPALAWRRVDVRILLALVMFGGAVWSDLRTRRVINPYWMPFVAFAAIFWAHDLVVRPQEMLWPAVGALAMSGLFYGMWYLGFFGGADAKGMMVAAWLVPGVPDLFGNRFLPVLDAFLNGALLTLALPVLFVVWNSLRGQVLLPAMLLGTPWSLAHARRSHVWPMQDVHEGRIVWRYWPKIGTDMDAVYVRLQRHGLDRVWVTPKVPFMVNLAVGFLLATLYGNLALRLVSAIMAP